MSNMKTGKLVSSLDSQPHFNLQLQAYIVLSTAISALHNHLDKVSEIFFILIDSELES